MINIKVCITLSLWLFSTIGFTQSLDIKNLCFINEPKFDSNGNLLPMQSSAQTVERSMNFVSKCDRWVQVDPKTLIDENGVSHPPYFFYSAFLNDDGGQRKMSYISYPAFHHSLFIKAFLRYYRYSGNKDFLQRALDLADWNISHSTPLKYPYGGMPYSTCAGGKMGGFIDGQAIMTDKAAIMGLSYLELYQATHNKKYLDAASIITANLAKTQKPEGNWSFRVDPETRKVKEEYTSSAIYGVMLFEEMDKVSGNPSFQKSRERAMKWIMENPVKTLLFNGFYEDVKADTTNRTNWDCIDLVKYLLAHLNENPAWLQQALKLNNYIEKTFIDHDHPYKPAEGIREQFRCFVTMGIHSAHWASMMADFYRVTGDRSYRHRAIQTMNFVTYLQQNNGRILVSADGYPYYWYSCDIGTDLYLLDFLETFPELRIDNPKHLNALHE